MKYLILLSCFLFLVMSCDWNKTWKGICYNPNGQDYYQLENSFDKSYVQNNLIDCQDEHCKYYGVMAPGNGSLISIENQNDLIFWITISPSFWGFKPLNDEESDSLTTTLFMQFGIDIGFPINETTWVDCQNTLGISEISIQFQQMDKDCKQIGFIGQNFTMGDGLQFWFQNPSICIMD